MGSWGPGLYSDDYAADLRTTVATLCRLPLSGAEVVAMLKELEQDTAVAPDDEDYTTFWLVVADQLHRRGIASPATERAIAIIDDGSNIAALAEREMAATDLRKREAVLGALRTTLTSPPPVKERRTLKAPQPLLVQPGDVFTFPIDQYGNVSNPYLVDHASFDPVGWGCCLIVAAGHALNYLAWYQIASNVDQRERRPELADALAILNPHHSGLGTLTRTHLRRMNFGLLGTVEPPHVEAPSHRDVIETVVNDVSAANLLHRWVSFGG